MRKIRKLLCLLLIVGLATVWAAADSLERPVEPDEIVTAPNQTVKGAFDLNGTTYYMGTLEGGFDLILAEDQYEDIPVQIDFYTSPNQGGQDGAATEYQKVTDQTVLDDILQAFGDTLELKLYPVELNTGSGTVSPPEYWPAVTEENTAQRAMKLKIGLRQQRCWMLSAAGTIQGKKVTATSILHWWPESQIYMESFSDLKEMNDWLAGYPWLNEQITYVLTLNAGEYTGQIVVPARFEGIGLSIRGSEDDVTTLHGGIIFQGGFAPSVESIAFVGAGQDQKSWEDGRENYALSGAGTFRNCSFTGYDHAIHCGPDSAILTTGTDSWFEDNAVAIYYNNTTATGGNPDISCNSFLNNGTALYMEDLNRESVPMTHFRIVDNNFVDNTADVVNNEQRRLYLPGNYFGTTEDDLLPSLIKADLRWVSAYPQLAEPAGIAAVLAMDAAGTEPAATYLYDLEQEPRVSVAFAAQYPIPAASLSGKVITVLDGDAELAILDFTGAAAAGQGSFDPTVSVQKKGNTLVFSMHEACGKYAVVRIPCGSRGWTGAKVTHNGQRLEAEVSGGWVSFTASGGQYAIAPVWNEGYAGIGPAAAGTVSGLELLNPFQDLDANGWYAQAVQYCIEKGLMSGVAEDRFAPDSGMTRAMVWTALGRMSGEALKGSGETWYAEARSWAMANGVSDGANPNGQVTREELVTMLWRFAGKPKGDISVLEQYQDGASVSSWAREAMAWGVESGLIEGAGQRLMPSSEALRCQVAAIIMRYETQQ